MAISPAVLFGAAPVPNAAAALYTSPANTTTVVTRIVFTNVSAGAVALKIWIVRNGGSRGNDNLMIGATASGQVMALGPSEPYIANGLANLVLKAGDAIHAVCDTANALNAVGSGWTQ